MVERGKVIYVPPMVIKEMEIIKIEEGLFGNSEAMRKMVNYSKIGRETKKIRDKFLLVDLMEPKKKFKKNPIGNNVMVGGEFKI